MPVARKRKSNEAPENHERWLITYADLITLLLIFFVIMYAMSKIDTAKYEVLSRALSLEFTKSDTFLPRNAGFSGNLTPGKGQDGDQEKKNQESEQDKKEKELQDLLDKVQQYIDEQQLQGQVSAADTPRGIAITLNDLFLFDLGKADLKPAAFPILERLASLFPTLNSKISVEGHTDNLPLATGSLYQDNWGLSDARSLSVLRYFINTAKLKDSNFISTGYSDTMPVAPNDTPENRQKNRRVEIIILRGSN
jgi:chemotaxis protein MotB